MRGLLLAVLLVHLAASEDLLGLTAWPAIIQDDEHHRLAFHLDLAQAGTVSLRWDDGEERSFPAPAGGSDGLLPLPSGLGLHRGAAWSGPARTEFAVHLAEASDPWPVAGLRQGLPVDEQGVAVVLVVRRPGANDLRRARLVQASATRPDGLPLLVGDPLAGPGGDVWQGLPAERRVAVDGRYPQHAALAALADPGQARSILWSPGNAALHAGTWEGEGRLCNALAARCAALALRPRLVLLLPPWPRDDGLRDEATRRSRALTGAALGAGWEVLDLAAIAGDPALANRMADGLFTDHPLGAAQERIRSALRDTLLR